jgi:magnesium transporter
MISFFYRNLKEPTFRQTDEFRSGTFVYCEQPTQEDLAHLSALMKLDTNLMADVLDPYEGSRVEILEEDVYVFTRIPYERGTTITTLPILFVVGKEGTLLLAQEKPLFLDSFLEKGKGLYTTQKAKFFLQFFKEVPALYRRFLVRLDKEVRNHAANVGTIDNENVEEFVKYEQTLNDFLSALVPTQTTVSRLISAKQLQFFSEDEELVEDVALAFTELVEIARSISKTISNIRAAFETLSTNDLNKSIRILTAITIILAIPTMLASFFGMNVPLPFEHIGGAFWVILAIALFFAGVVLLIFARNRWL